MRLINGLGLKHFKAFNDESYLSFKKMNIFLGPNSSGKSSYLKGLLLLNESIKSDEEQPALHLNEEIGDYKSIVFGKDSKQQISFTITLENAEHLSEEELQIIVDRNRTQFIISLLNSKNAEQISIRELDSYIDDKIKSYLSNPVHKIHFSVKQTNKKPNVVHKFNIAFKDDTEYVIEMDRNSYYLKKGNRTFSQPNIVLPKKFLFKVDDTKFHLSSPNEMEDLLTLSIALLHFEIQLTQFFRQFLRIEPFRNKPSRTEHIANFKFNSVGSNGQNLLSTVIGLNQQQKEKEVQTVKSDVNKWLKEFELAQSVDAQDLKNNQYSLIIKNRYTGIDNNIMDVGVGTSQLLPIIVESFLSPKNSVLVIEEPETHIHPNAQAKLADLFVSCIEKDNKRFFVETHSMYFVQKMQILVAQGKINPEDVGIYYFQQSESGTQIQHLTLAQNGQFQQEFPKGFFDVAFELSKQFMDAMM